MANCRSLLRSKLRQGLCWGILLGCLAQPGWIAAAPFSYTNLTVGAINGGISCAGAARLTRTIAVPDDFFIDDLDVGFIATHTWRGDINATLTSPAGTAVQFTPVQTGFAGRHNNYNVLFDDASANPANDGNNDNVAVPPYLRVAAPTNAFSAYDGENASGTWTLTICDAFPFADNGQFRRLELQFTSRDDYGDAPNSYLTLAASGGPQNVISSNLNLGPAVSNETDGTPSATASADSNDDGTSFAALDDGTTSVSQGVLVTNNTGATANLVGWIDFNQNGSFDSGEAASTTVATGSTGVIAALSWSGLNLSSINCSQNTFARIRLTTDTLTATDVGGLKNDGETEDYLVPVDCTAQTTPVLVSDFRAAVNSADGLETGARIDFNTRSEIGLMGLRIERADHSGQFRRIHSQPWLLPARPAPQGAAYSLLDPQAEAGGRYLYRVIELDHSGKQKAYGPFPVNVAAPVSPSDNRQLPLTAAETLQQQPHQDTAMMARLAAAKRPPKQTGSAAKANLAGPSLSRQLPLVVGVQETGLYFISFAQLADVWGVSRGTLRGWSNSGRMRLTVGAESVSWQPGDDGIYFYAQALELTGGDSLYANQRFYRLEPNRRGSQMRQRSVPAGRGEAGMEFTALEAAEEDVSAFLSAADDKDDDYWVWRFMSAGSPASDTSFELQLQQRQQGAGEIRLQFLGLSNDRHNIEIYLNDTLLDRHAFNGVGESEVSLPVDQDAWLPTDNRLNLVALNNRAQQNSVVGVDGYAIKYPRSYAEAGSELFYQVNPSAVRNTEISGLTAGSVFTLKIDNQRNPVWINGGTVSGPDADQTLSARLPEGKYLSVTEAGLRQPSSLRLIQSGNLKSAGNRADYLIISPEALLAGAGELADYRSSANGGGHRSMVVELDHIYDQFSHSQPNSDAIAAFIHTTQINWRLSPGYILLLGDGSFDHRGRVAPGYDLLPPLMTPTVDGLHAADNLYADIDGDRLPDAAVGRIPAKFNQEISDYLAKVRAYESAPRSSELPYLQLADNPDSGGNFPQSATALGAVAPGATSQLELLPQDLDQSRTLLFDALQAGATVVNYVGHAAVNQMAHEGWLRNADIGSLNNADHPVMLGLSCLLARYTLPGFDALGEDLMLTPQQGMIAVWSTTGLSVNPEAVSLGLAFHNQLRTANTLGEAILGSLYTQGFSNESAELYTLLGDPGLQIRR